MTEIANGVFYCGIHDRDRKVFDQLVPLPQGTTYNSYLVSGTGKTALIDTMYEKFGGEYLDMIRKSGFRIDYIISKLAKDEDLWFHTKDCAGSHVLLKGDNPPDNLILECAKLAKENSSAPDSSKIGVIYTKRKYLRKPPKANLGYVTYKNEKEIIID